MGELNAKAEDPALWDDPNAAQEVMRERTRITDALDAYQGLERDFNDNLELLEMAEAEGDGAIAAEAEKELIGLHKRAAKMELESLLSGEADANDCFLEVHAGAGGTESQDWAEMLLRMYVRWAESRGFEVAWLEESAGEEAGIKSATIKVQGHNVYGWPKTESGAPRRVRIARF